MPNILTPEHFYKSASCTSQYAPAAMGILIVLFFVEEQLAMLNTKRKPYLKLFDTRVS
jgi:hypothetical protein